MSSQVAFEIDALTFPSLDLAHSSLCGPLTPSVADWAALNETVGGRLYHGYPFAKPCFSTYNGNKIVPNTAECAYVQENYVNNHMNRSHAFGGYGYTQFEMCMSTGGRSSFAPQQQCSQGRISPLSIDIQDKDDIVAAFKFSKKQGVNLAIKNTGQDFNGRSAAPDSLGLWLHNLKYINHVENFVSGGCNVDGQPALTFGAGTQFHDIAQFTDEHRLQFVGGSDQSVGAAGGWSQGGGHSPLSPNYGMGADRTLQYKVVTPDGIFRTVNACLNEDLFFALRGGGGGTFGVVLEATMMVTPSQTFQMANINWPINDDNLRSVIGNFLNNVTAMAKNGWGGYLTPSIGNLVLITPRMDLPAAQEMMKPLVDLTTAMGGNSSVTHIASYNEWFQGWAAGTIGLPAALASRLIPAKNHETTEGRAELHAALMNAFASSIFSQIHITTPYGFNGSKGLDTSVHPIWRSVLYQVMLVNSWYWDGTLADRELAYSQSTKAVNFLRDIMPGLTSYNEADIHEPDFEVAFWGGHYPRLLEIKNK
ncbi:FAD-binding domain-containing protein [Gymnopilus junonius]|uniref:FAD-binding domain-containing protein n=1 Tax=Gymnopilus junonius TaxID=109634 RepID=A0A9P5P2U3_GYMJU|nr:FAD-binding domain-containing protein [Gymnopilus junonius]